MGVIRLERAEKRLVEDVEHGDKTEFTKKRERISAEVVRHIMLGLPLFRRGIWPFAPARACATTGAGVSLSGALIDGRVELAAVIGAQGGPLYPLEFRDCIFEGGFCGAHAHFSRLSFKNCAFVDCGDRLDPDSGRPLPTLDLSGAKLDGDLDMRGVRPEPRGRSLAWIRAPGVRVDGRIDLSGCLLSTPAAPADDGADRPEDAVDLSLAVIKGDLVVRQGSELRGRFKLRGARIEGDFWLDGAKLINPGVRTEALFMQGAEIGGFLSLACAAPDRPFECHGNIDLTATEVAHSLIVRKASIRGSIRAPDLVVRDDFFLHAETSGVIDLEHMTIGGSLDLSDLQVEAGAAFLPAADPAEPGNSEPKPALNLKDGRIGRELRLTPSKWGGRVRLAGAVDLTGLTCDTLDDEVGRAWGRSVCIRMNHFVYRKTGWLPDWLRVHLDERPSHHILSDWFLARRAEGHWPLNWLWRTARLERDDYWEPWQLRRNWVYQQFDTKKRDPVSIARHTIDEPDYRPQPFEQAIRVARAEGREDFAVHFEMLKQRIEWRLMNRMVRWWLGFTGIALGTLWLVLHQPLRAGAFDRWLVGWTLAALIVTLLLMIRATTVHRGVLRLLKRDPGPLSAAATWMVFFAPVLLLVGHSPWWSQPFHFLVAALIFAAIRFVSVFAHAAMRFGFGYLRRPIRAVVTLILAFLLGWWGTEIARTRDMLVVEDTPAAGQGATRGRPVAEVSCADQLSAPLYALDVLIPIVDLREESRCGIRRRPAPGRPVHNPGKMSIYGIWEVLPDLPLNDNRFWWWMKAIYAIIGWFLVSLAILTFAQVNRARADPPSEQN